MSGPILYVTGTNTGVGKTTLATLLLRRARERKIPMAALKPFCSGGREDAEELHQLQTAGLTLDEVNPFHFREPLTPLLAARKESRRVLLDEVLKSTEAARRRNLPLVVEGAGGLLSPLGEDYSLQQIIERISGKVCVVAANALGVLNLALLTMRQLPVTPSAQAVVLMTPVEWDLSTKENAGLLRSLLPGVSLFEIPRSENLTVPKEVVCIIDSVLDWWL